MSQRKDNWNRLDALTRQVESNGVKSLSQTELRDFGLLYRQSAADLSAARADPSATQLEHYLNRLVARAHNFVYSGRKLGFRSLWDFFAHGYPRLIRRAGSFLTLATTVFLLGALLGTIITVVRPEFAYAFMSPKMISDLDQHKMWTESILGSEPQESSQIMTNNISVCFMTFLGGITAGIGTLYLLFFNGLMLGVIAVTCARHHMALSLWSFVASHGALELPAIFIAGAAGLRLASGILFPGMLRRRDSIAQAGEESVRILFGCIPLLIVAGSFEGFLSPSHAPIALKFSVCAVLFLALCFWLTEGGRRVVKSSEESVEGRA